MKRRIGIMIALAVLLAVGGFFILNHTRAVFVEVSIAAEDAVVRRISETGYFVSVKERTITALHPMVLEEVNVAAGDVVASGFLLARGDVAQLEVDKLSIQTELQILEAEIDGQKRSLPVQLASALGHLDLARDEHLEAQKHLESMEVLHAEGAAAEQDVRAARLRVSASEVQVDSAGVAVDQIRRELALLPARTRQIETLAARLRALQRRIQEHHITAPGDLVAAGVWVSAGDVVSPGTPLFLLQGEEVRVEVDLLAGDAREVLAGQRVLISGEALGNAEVTGTVDRVHPRAVETRSELGVTQRRVRVEITLSDIPEDVRPGYPADVDIVTAGRHGLAIDRDAIFTLGGKDHVFGVLENTAHLTEIPVGLLGEDLALVAAGLNPEDRVIINPPRNLEDGARVTVTDPSEGRKNP